MLNLDELELFIKSLPERGLIEKGKNPKGGKKYRQRMTVMFILMTMYDFQF